MGPKPTTPMLNWMFFRIAERSIAVAIALRLAGSLKGGAPEFSSKPLNPIAGTCL